MKQKHQFTKKDINKEEEKKIYRQTKIWTNKQKYGQTNKDITKHTKI